MPEDFSIAFFLEEPSGTYYFPEAGGNNYSISFDGSNDYVRIEDDLTLDVQSSITLSAWVKPSDGTDEPILAKEGGNGFSYLLHIFRL